MRMVNLDSYIDSKGIKFLHRIIDEPRKIVDVIRDLHREYEPVFPVNPE
jgi:hypothetical protein